MSVEYEIPPSKVAAIKKYLGINGQPVADWPLDPGQAREVGHVLGVRLDLDGLDFFLEPSRAPVHA